ncbi:MAG: hypothetical protein ABIS50_07655 [Luteolibacter sp.]|uniref:hypothetical protein n=1 Tax=Luteolibacter sp. TaxID=1962973 RepID=UPI0032669DB1
MIAATTIGDGIAIIVFATFLLFLGLGVLGLLKFLFRLISGKRRPVEAQSVCVCFEQKEGWDKKDETGVQPNVIEMQKFARYLESRIRSGGLGEFDGGEFQDDGVRLYFFGPDAKLIWQRIQGDVRDYAPTKPLELRFNYGKKAGGKEVLNIAEDGPQPSRVLPEFKTEELLPNISPAWKMAWLIGIGFTAVGLVGLFLCWLIRIISGMSEREFMSSGFGSFVAFTLSGMFIGGMVLALICSSHSQRTARRPDPGPLGRGIQGPPLPGWISNKFILVIVAAVITGVMVMLFGGLQ